MVQPLGEADHFEPFGRGRGLILLPAHRLGDLHRREGLRIALLQHRLGAGDLVDREIGGVAAAEEPEAPGGQHQNDDKGDCDFAEDCHVGGDRAAPPLRQHTSFEGPPCHV